MAKKHWILSVLFIALCITAVYAMSALQEDTRAPQEKQQGRRILSPVFLTNNLKMRDEVDTFERAETIYAVVTGVKEKGEHLLEAKWLDMSGEIKQKSRYRFNVASVPVDAWVTWERDPGVGGRMFSNWDMFAVSGLFTVKIYLDKKLIAEKQFYIQ